MALNDCVPWNLLERLISSDLNTNSDLLNRMIAEITRGWARMVTVGTSHNDEPTVTMRTHVASGLTVGQDGGGTAAVVKPGFLLQQVPSAPPDVPVPGTFDSTYRMGLLLANEDVGDPWDGVAGFWLLQARVVRVDALTEVRDIFNPATQTFAPGPAIVKRYESRIEFDWKKGNATDLPLPDAGWAPIAGLNSNMAGVTNAQLINLAVQLEDLSPASTAQGRPLRTNFKFKTEGGIGTILPGGLCTFDLEAEVAGARCYARTPTGAPRQLNDTNHIEAASAAALAVANTWGYVYLAPLTDAMPREAPGTTAAGMRNCVLVISRTPPDEFGHNTVAITPPPPFTNYTIPVRGAAHVGLVMAGPAGIAVSMWPIAVSKSGYGQVTFRQFNNASFQMTQANGFDGPAGPAYNLAVLGPGGTEDVPIGVDLECVLQHLAVPALAPVAAALEVTFGMGAGAPADNIAAPGSWARMLLPTMTLAVNKFWLRPHPGNMTMTLAFVPRTIALANSGGGAGDGVGVVMEAGMIGFQF
jgi:hypothetical protein